MFGISKEYERTDKRDATIPLTHKLALAALLHYGSMEVAYQKLIKQIGEDEIPHLEFISHLYGIVPEAKGRPSPEFIELDELLDDVRDGNCNRNLLQPRAKSKIYNVERALVNHSGTMLFLRESESSQNLFIGRDRLRGVFSQGSPRPLWTLPMTYSQREEDPQLSLLRLFQQEVFPDLSSSGILGIGSKYSKELIPESISPIFQLYLYDVLINAYEIVLPVQFHEAAKNAYEWSRLEEAGFADVSHLASESPFKPGFRNGFIDALKIKKLCDSGFEIDGRFMSSINQQIRDVMPLPYGYISVPTF
jgi:hypothetical protein